MKQSEFEQTGYDDDQNFSQRDPYDQNSSKRQDRKRNMDMTIEDRDLDYY